LQKLKKGRTKVLKGPEIAPIIAGIIIFATAIVIAPSVMFS
jgi:hypothetical protein